ncbi:PhyR family response regulator anti-anti-sigma factor [Lacibacterium aquatile]|uniref:PhyR family response regulator anti-anti-sigma factor n=1 Tax=Lacibacterium aquatile TaxID=1168082 RepID=A0ABW5E206_9PROT
MSELQAKLAYYLAPLRRYARALTGDQAQGDRAVVAAVKDLLATPDVADDGQSLKLTLYRLVSQALTAEGELVNAPSLAPGYDGLSWTQRQLIVLTDLEGMTVADASLVLGLSGDVATSLLTQTREQLRKATATDILIIEDEFVIAMDISNLVTTAGHRVVGIASDHMSAVKLAKEKKPGLILADINLGTGGSGNEAVAEILESHDVPVIFVTAYPERLLTGSQIEPNYVLTKPFDPMTLGVATFQALATWRQKLGRSASAAQ